MATTTIDLFSQTKSRYQKGFTFYDNRGIKVTLVEWVKLPSVFGDLYRWKAKFEGLGVVADGWTDDKWIDVYTKKAFLNEQTHQIVYYDSVDITPKKKINNP